MTGYGGSTLVERSRFAVEIVKAVRSVVTSGVPVILRLSQWKPKDFSARLAETPEAPLVVHGVQHILHPPTLLPRWPDSDQRTRLVFITRDIEERTIRELFSAFLNQVAPDRLDRKALIDNPLTPFGGVDR